MNIMVRLKNIQRRDNLIEADFYPEGSKIAGHIVVDITTEEDISCKEVFGYGPSYKFFAKRRLIKMVKNNEIKSEDIIMWY